MKLLCVIVKPRQGGNTIRQLLKIAKKTVPQEEWSRTPVVLKATAGLRLLPVDKANALLKEVRCISSLSPETAWHKHYAARRRARRETAEKPLLTSVSEKAATWPMWWLSFCKRKPAVVGLLCGAIIFVIWNINSSLQLQPWLWLINLSIYNRADIVCLARDE